MPKRELTEFGARPGTEGIFLNEGRLAWSREWLATVFWISGKRALRRPISTGLPEGITRNFVLALATEMGIKHRARPSTSGIELLYADEVLVTNSIQEIVPVTGLRTPKDGDMSPADGLRRGDHAIT